MQEQLVRIIALYDLEPRLMKSANFPQRGNAMNRQAGIERVVRGGVLIACLCLLSITAGCGASNQIGRFELAGTGSEHYVIDTATGQVWEPGSGMLSVPKSRHASWGRTGRFKLVVAGSSRYVIDTATGQVWQPGDGIFALPKD